LLDYRSGQELATFAPLDAPMVSWLCFNRAGTQLAVAGENNTVQMWDLRSVRRQLAALGLDWSEPSPESPSFLPTNPPGSAEPVEFGFHIPPRAAGTSPRLLDLTAFYNASLTNMWASDGAGNDLASLPPGVQTLSGVDYDVRGSIHVRGGDAALGYPDVVKGIHVGQKCLRLHFLGGVASKPVNGQVVATNLIHYADGNEIEMPVIAGRDTANWWFLPGESAHELDVAWTGSNAWVSGSSYRIRLLHFAWSNPHPDAPIKTLDFISALGGAAPFLVAITAE
jgi:hypothetical protein